MKVHEGLITIVELWIDGCDPSNARRIPLIFCPLVICDVEFKLCHDTLDRRKCSHLGQADICKDTMNDEVSRLTPFITAKRFLMKLKLLCMNGRIGPFDRANLVDRLILVIDNDEFIPVGILDCLHPMSMQDARCHFVLCRACIDETELEDF